jgi:hypothetical protein
MLDLPYEENVDGIEEHHGICTEECLEHYKERYDIPNSYFNKGCIKSLKHLGHHELADWICRGGLEELMEREGD